MMRQPNGKPQAKRKAWRFSGALRPNDAIDFCDPPKRAQTVDAQIGSTIERARMGRKRVSPACGLEKLDGDKIWKTEDQRARDEIVVKPRLIGEAVRHARLGDDDAQEFLPELCGLDVVNGRDLVDLCAFAEAVWRH